MYIYIFLYISIQFYSQRLCHRKLINILGYTHIRLENLLSQLSASLDASDYTYPFYLQLHNHLYQQAISLTLPSQNWPPQGSPMATGTKGQAI